MSINNITKACIKCTVSAEGSTNSAILKYFTKQFFGGSICISDKFKIQFAPAKSLFLTRKKMSRKKVWMRLPKVTLIKFKRKKKEDFSVLPLETMRTPSRVRPLRRPWWPEPDGPFLLPGKPPCGNFLPIQFPGMSQTQIWEDKRCQIVSESIHLSLPPVDYPLFLAIQIYKHGFKLKNSTLILTNNKGLIARS